MLSAQRDELDRRRQEADRREHWKLGLDRKLGLPEYQKLLFERYDKDNSGYLNLEELGNALKALGLHADRRDLTSIMKSMDIGAGDDAKGRGDGLISFAEFQRACNAWVPTTGHHRTGSTAHRPKSIPTAGAAQPASPVDEPKMMENKVAYGAIDPANNNDKPAEAKNGSGDDDEQDCEEEEEQYLQFTERQLIMKAVSMLFVGTALIALFSDAIIDIISALGNEWNISPFYISFVVTPIASNASEMIAGLTFAKKKTNEGVSLTFASLHGAATMNHTLGLCIFLALMYFRGLAWSYSAEVLTVCLVTIAVGINGLRTNIFLWQGLLCLLIYPFSILFVWLLEGVAGLD